MLKIEEAYKIICDYAPIEYSLESIARGEYDNSGILVDTGNDTRGILFSLDLSKKAVEKARENGCNLIVTHHPAIYSPIKSLSVKNGTAPVLLAIKNGVSVISMHLNLDTAKEGIDHFLARCCGATEYKIIDPLFSGGYGRVYGVDKTLAEFTDGIKKELSTERVTYYGEGSKKAGTVASFCGAGSSLALRYLHESRFDADTIVTSDVPHHVIKELLDLGKNLVVIAHYPAEEYGFFKFYEKIRPEFEGKAETLYFCDTALK